MDKSTNQSAINLLTANREATDEHEDRGRRLRRARLVLIAAARKHGMPWDQIAHHLGWSDGHALRMWYRRAGGTDD